MIITKTKAVVIFKRNSFLCKQNVTTFTETKLVSQIKGSRLAVTYVGLDTTTKNYEITLTSNKEVWYVRAGDVLLDFVEKYVPAPPAHKFLEEFLPIFNKHTDQELTLNSEELKEAGERVKEVLNPEISIKASQFTALLSFALSQGLSSFSRSRLLKSFNDGNFEKTEREFMRWTKARGGKVDPNKLALRKAEALLFSTGKVCN